MKKAITVEDQQNVKKRCLDLLERYIYLILFNTYLHCDRYNKWQRSFSTWMREVWRLQSHVQTPINCAHLHSQADLLNRLKGRDVNWLHLAIQI